MLAARAAAAEASNLLFRQNPRATSNAVVADAAEPYHGTLSLVEIVDGAVSAASVAEAALFVVHTVSAFFRLVFFEKLLPPKLRCHIHIHLKGYTAKTLAKMPRRAISERLIPLELRHLCAILLWCC